MALPIIGLFCMIFPYTSRPRFDDQCHSLPAGFYADDKRHNCPYAYNGDFGCTCYHPVFAFNQLADVERCALRFGNVRGAHGWRVVLERAIARYRDTSSVSISEVCVLRQPRSTSPSSRGYGLCNPTADQPHLAEQDRILGQAPGWATAA